MKKLYIKTQGNAIVTASVYSFEGAIEIDVDDSIGIGYGYVQCRQTCTKINTK